MPRKSRQIMERLPNDPTPREILRIAEQIRESWPSERLAVNERYSPANVPLIEEPTIQAGRDPAEGD